MTVLDDKLKLIISSDSLTDFDDHFSKSILLKGKNSAFFFHEE